MSFIITRGLGRGSRLVTLGFGDSSTSTTSTSLFDPFKNVRKRGIQFANVLSRDASPSALRGAQRASVETVNTIMPIQMEVGQSPSRVNLGPTGNFNGAIKYRFRNYRNFGVPSSINAGESQEVYSFTGPRR